MQSNAHNPDSQVGYIGQAFYLRAVTLSPLHYQKLLDLGWRRSGHLLYRPNLKKSCCIQYTIRLDATQFKPSREHRKALHRWENYVVGQGYLSECARKYPKTREEKKKLKTEFDLFRSVHGPEYPYLRTPPEPNRKFEVTLEPSTFTEEKYSLFQNYQFTVHHEGPEKVSEYSFQRFLCNSPLIPTPASPSDGGKRMGSFHQMYRLNGRLIAMAVLDFLPWCVSGVYFMYHSDFSEWGFGKLSACREAALAAEEGYKYYYMGFYIHNCPKMKYKGQFHPTYFLDPENNVWNLLDEQVKKIMSEKFYCSPSKPDALSLWHPKQKDIDEGEELVDRHGSGDEDDDEYTEDLWASHMPGIPSLKELEEEVDLGEVKIYVPGIGHVVANFREGGMVRSAVEQFAAVVGPELATEIELRFNH
ncbi:arginine-tRNA-protein transferase [Terfezia claveryi]|nr:arginine-tRNA-protein transferase [Terfezia claveryi]